MKKQTRYFLVAVIISGIVGSGLYWTESRNLSSFSKAEVITKENYPALQSLYDLSNEGMPLAMGKLAREYYDGINIVRNDDKAFYWATKGYEHHDGLSTFILARMNYYGEATKANPVKAIQLLNEIKDQKLEYKYILAKIYLEQGKVDKNNLGKGVELLMSAADGGLPQAQMEMANTLIIGSLYEDSLDIDKSTLFKRSAEYLAMAAAQDYKPAIRQLGLYFYNGIGVPKDTTKGMNYLNEAAQEGDIEASKILKTKNFKFDFNGIGANEAKT